MNFGHISFFPREKKRSLAGKRRAPSLQTFPLPTVTVKERRERKEDVNKRQ